MTKKLRAYAIMNAAYKREGSKVLGKKVEEGKLNETVAYQIRRYANGLYNIFVGAVDDEHMTNPRRLWGSETTVSQLVDAVDHVSKLKRQLKTQG